MIYTRSYCPLCSPRVKGYVVFYTESDLYSPKCISCSPLPKPVIDETALIMATALEWTFKALEDRESLYRRRN